MLSNKILGPECCSKIEVDVTNSDVRLHPSVGGVYEYVGKTHGRDSFKHQTNGYYLFYISKQNTSGNERWVIERGIEIKNDKGYELHGYVRHEGNETCPSEVGQNWYQVWNTTKIDPSILITCGKKNHIDILFVYK